MKIWLLICALQISCYDGVTSQCCPDIATSTTMTANTSAPRGVLTTRTGAPVTLQELNTLTGSTFLLRNKYFLETMSHFANERIPERVGHGRGSGAFGYFEVTHDISDICKAKVFNRIGKTTNVSVRFSPAIELRGGIDMAREARGFAVKFYTEDGNLDFPFFNQPVFFFNNPALFPPFVHSNNPSAVNFVPDNNVKYGFLTDNPETFNIVLRLNSDEGVTDGYRYMAGYSIHTMQVSNSKNETYFVRFIFTPDAGKKYLTPEQETYLSGTDRAYFGRDLYNAIGNGSCPSWTLNMQVLTWEDCKNAGFNVFDLTQFLPEDKYPFRPIGKLVLNRNPLDYFAEVEQIVFSPCNLVPGIQGAPDKTFEARCLAYELGHIHRLGVNFNNVRINKPVTEVHTYLRDGPPPVGSNDGSGPDYWPNSFNGPYPVDNTEPPLIQIDQIYPRYNLNQSIELYKTFSDGEKDRITTNIIKSLSYTFNSIQERVLQRFAEISPEIVQRIEQRLGRRYTCDEC